MNPSKYIFLLQIKILSYEDHLSFTLSCTLSLSGHAGAKYNESIYDTGAKQPRKKDYTKARYLFLQAYKNLAEKGDYKQAIDAGTQAAYLYYRENYYQEAFDLCRQMNQFILTEEQKLQKSLYEQRFQVTKERLEMYIKLKNAAQAQVQLNTLDNLASQAGDEKLSNNLLYTQAGYYYTFGQNEQGDAAFQKLINQYKEKKNTRR